MQFTREQIEAAVKAKGYSGLGTEILILTL